MKQFQYPYNLIYQLNTVECIQPYNLIYNSLMRYLIIVLFKLPSGKNHNLTENIGEKGGGFID